jgi:hypothetical protein
VSAKKGAVSHQHSAVAQIGVAHQVLVGADRRAGLQGHVAPPAPAVVVAFKRFGAHFGSLFHFNQVVDLGRVRGRDVQGHHGRRAELKTMWNTVYK